ncbi:MAG: DUF2281 domain-containing protein [Symploca sp. SIO1B1]|nr:DUF2281 domain-containing protein [Symploca sp. SIO1C2]NER96514.1 DUF2281 domain-containing protein [Symploca sp. SIO1B1]
MTLLEKIVTELASAPEPLLLQVLDFIQMNKVASASISDSENLSRIPGLHQGQIWMGEDFNDPLPMDNG